MGTVDTAPRAEIVVVYEPRMRRLRDAVRVHHIDREDTRAAIDEIPWPAGEGGGFPALLDRLETDLAVGYRRFMVDLHDVRYLASTGIGHLIFAYQVARQEGGVLVVTRPNEQVARVWTIMKLATMIPLLPDIETAVAQLRLNP